MPANQQNARHVGKVASQQLALSFGWICGILNLPEEE